ncbi:hypothetical protein OCU04_001303 [Sclerotinia nivalis]|uniref:Fungal N-terminal domain-containing protein n=1 Tax=Sclerotinia nivalis TaxID=352851 RepID=A0A9X0AYA2_9HELO|nr:hypothetical protein OCU04_001303 [Sclerotinia nivalis]
MTDPFSAASGAVGVISIGLQVSQNLVKYCSQYKSFVKDIITFKSKAETLNVILQQLGDKLQQLEQKKWTLPTSVIDTIEKCEAGLRGLDKELQKHGRVTISNRITYPFIKDSLTVANAMLDSLQNNLTLALQSFNVQVIQDHLNNEIQFVNVEQRYYQRVIELSQMTLQHNTQSMQMFDCHAAIVAANNDKMIVLVSCLKWRV